MRPIPSRWRKWNLHGITLRAFGFKSNRFFDPKYRIYTKCYALHRPKYLCPLNSLTWYFRKASPKNTWEQTNALDLGPGGCASFLLDDRSSGRRGLSAYFSHKKIQKTYSFAPSARGTLIVISVRVRAKGSLSQACAIDSISVFHFFMTNGTSTL